MLEKDGTYKNIRSQDLKVGQIIKLKKDDRVPADFVLLYTTETNGNIFIRTDQLDGETDWKLRKAIPQTQDYGSTQADPSALIRMPAFIFAMKPHDEIY